MGWFGSKKEVVKEVEVPRELSSFQKELAEKAQAQIDEKEGIESARKETVRREVRGQVQDILRKYAGEGRRHIESQKVVEQIKLTVNSSESEVTWRIRGVCEELGLHTFQYTNHIWRFNIYLIPPR